MALTILERPEGRILSPTPQTANVTSSYGTGDATAYKVAPHNLADGDYIYVVSNIEDYNGFWYVDSTGTYTFKLKQYPTSDYVQYFQDAEITYYVSTAGHGWSSVHLPITYRISSSLYPTNTLDIVRSVTSAANSDGYTALNLFASLGTIHTYDYLYLTTPNADISGVYQIVEWVSTTVVIINLAYSSDNDFTDATAQKYYNNYNVIVRIYAGIRASHEWAIKKPYELADTLELIPDSNGQVFFSVHEALKAYVKTVNNPLISTQPNNIDFWTNFYIEIAERYDDSDGYALGTFTSSYTSDQATFEGYAVNSMLEFKNVYSGYLSEYVMTTNTSKFLTLFAIPVLFGCTDQYPDCYSDVSFIINEQQAPNPIVSSTANGYTNNSESGNSWNLPTSAVTFTNIGASTTKSMMTRFKGISGVNYTFNYSVRLSGVFTASGNVRIGLVGLDINGVRVTATNVLATAVSGSTVNASGSVVFTPSVDIEYIGFVVDISGTLSSGNVTGLVLSFSQQGTATYKLRSQFYYNSVLQSTVNEDIANYDEGVYRMPLNADCSYDRVDLTVIRFLDGVEDQPISETKQLKIDCGCSFEEIRLTWLNNLGGFEYWNFTANKDLLTEIRETGQVTKSIFPEWPKSYSKTADTIRKQTFRDTNKAYTVRSQYMTKDELEAVSYIKSSVLVQIINSISDRRTVIVDADSFRIYTDQDKLYSIIFNVSFTDDIPSQTA